MFAAGALQPSKSNAPRDGCSKTKYTTADTRGPGRRSLAPWKRLLSFLALVAIALVGFAPPLLADILPADRRTVWNPGLPGGIPARTTVCANVNASTYGNGTSNATAGIQAALDACPAGQVVQLSAGTFLINNGIVMLNKGVTLRGAGPGVTTLKRTNGATPGSYTASVADPVVIIGANRWPRRG